MARSSPRVSANTAYSSWLLRAVALGTASTALVFTLNNYLIFWRGWPGVQPLFTGIEGEAMMLGVLQLFFYPAAAIAVILWSLLDRRRTLTTDAAALAALAAYIARAAFWSVLFVGIADMIISFLRVEALLADIVGEAMARDLGRSQYRGDLIHYPLIGLAFLISLFSRSLGFTWLALLIVLAEFQIVLARFIFSYEQAFMGDLVRFWYAALFLFASAYTLLHEGHVRVDVLYTTFSDRGKAWSNVVGSLILGVPLCWVIMTSGMWDKSNLINAPLLSYEVSQSGYGMYVKYFMAGFLLIYALTMLIQFLGYFLRNAAILRGDPDAERLQQGHAV